MSHNQFTLITIISEPVLQTTLLESIHEMGVTGYTITEVIGQGSGDKNSSEVPGEKIKIELIVETSATKKVMETIADKFFENYSLITYAMDISVLRSQKFQTLKATKEK